MVELIFAGTKSVFNLQYKPFGYHQPWGAFFSIDDTGVSAIGQAKVFLDGTAVSVGKKIGTTYWGTSPYGMVAGWNNNVYSTEPLIVRPLWHQQLNTPSSFNMLAYPFAVDQDNGLLIAYTGRVYDLVTGTEKCRGYIGVNQLAAHYYAPGQVIFFNPYGWNCFIYDYMSEEVISKFTLPSSIRNYAYDPVNKVIVVQMSTYKLNLYTTTDIGYTLSAPSFTAPILTKTYGGSQVVVRLTDKDGDGVPKKWIHWELFALRGDLEFDRTLTDTDGYAYNYYYGPAGTNLGSETLTAYVVV